MKSPTMLYRCPGPLEFEGVACETTIVDEPDVEAALADGWHRNWIEAGAARLATNEAELAEVEKKLGGHLHAVHKGRGKYDVLDADGKVVYDNLTKEEAQAKVGG